MWCSWRTLVWYSSSGGGGDGGSGADSSGSGSGSGSVTLWKKTMVNHDYTMVQRGEPWLATIHGCGQP